MLLSSILQADSVLWVNCKFINEQEFDTLGLLVAQTELRVCSFLDSEKYIESISPNVTMVITSEELSGRLLEKNIGVCIVDKPRNFFFKVHNFLSGNEEYVRKKIKRCIGKECNIANEAVIADYNVVIGNHVTIEEFAVVRENTVIGDNTIIRAGAKIGGEGFEFKRSEDKVESVKHLGGVIIGNHVEIQYNTCIDKAVYPWDNTVVGDYVKIDNLVHVGHAVKVDKGVMIVAQSGIGGRTVIAPETWIGFGTTVSNGLHIGRNARANIGSVVTKDICDYGSVTGNFAIDHRKFIDNLKKLSN